MKQDKALAMIGLAQKAGKIVSGEFATEKAVKTGKAALVIVAGDASECVHFMRCLFTFTVTKKHLVMQSANSFGHHSQSQMKALEIQSKSI